MGVREGDWATAARAEVLGAGRIRASFGVHPWFAHRHPLGGPWQDALRERLLAHPRAVLGEVGLDRVAVTPDTGRCEFELQLGVFEWQIALGAELARPVSMHCVRAQSHALALLRARETLPPVIVLHSYGGSIEMAREFLKLRAHVAFGFSECINTRNAAKTRALIAGLPADRLLIESDLDSPGTSFLPSLRLH